MSRPQIRLGSVMASPNIIPMADIMLVLLIIFMLVTPLLHPGAPVNMAQVANPSDLPDASKDSAVIVAITRDGNIFLGSEKIALAGVAPQVRDRISNRNDKTVFLKSDARAKYGDLVKVVEHLRAAGIDRIGLLTEKLVPSTASPQ